LRWHWTAQVICLQDVSVWQCQYIPPPFVTLTPPKVPDVAIGKEYKVDDSIPAGVIDTFAPAFADNLLLKLVIDTSSKLTAAV